MKRVGQTTQMLGIVVTLASLLIGGAASAGGGSEVIPSGTVIRVKLVEELSSKTARRGDRVRVKVDGEDRSGLPTGAALVARITEVRRATRSRPGSIDMQFRTLEMRDRWIPISGEPYSLDEKHTRKDSSGRLVAKKRSSDRMKFIGYGALGGVLLGKLLGTSTLNGVLLGAAGGYLYSQSRDNKRKFRDVEMEEGTEFGVRLNRRVVLKRSDF